MDILGFETAVNAWQLALLTAISAAVGVLGGLVGLALGTIRLPALLLLGVPAPLAGGTNILVSTLSAATGAVRHVRAGRVDWSIVRLMGIPSVVGALGGGLLASRVAEGLLIGLAGAFVVWQGTEFLIRARLARLSAAKGRGPVTAGRVVSEGGIGFTIGLLGGAVGLILGSIRLPAMVRFLGIDARTAAGTNLTIGFFLGTAGFVGHGLRGDLDVPLLVLMGSAGMAGSLYGATLTGRVRPERLLKVMGVVLLAVGLLLLWRAVAG